MAAFFFIKTVIRDSPIIAERIQMNQQSDYIATKPT